MGFKIHLKGPRANCRAHATFSILDEHDNTLRQLHETGKAGAPAELDDDVGGRPTGRHFTVHPAVCGRGGAAVTEEEKERSVRPDGSIRLRAVVHLFLDDEA